LLTIFLIELSKVVASLKLNQTSLNNYLNNTRTATQEEIHYKVMRLLEENPDLTQRELAQSLEVSVGGVNYCLKALVDKGWVKMKNFAHSKNKFGYIYVLTPSGLAEKALITQRFLQRKMDEYEQLKAEIEALKSEVKKDHEEMKKYD
jgi:EPS-associated MarR family transcriptional regulator